MKTLDDYADEADTDPPRCARLKIRQPTPYDSNNRGKAGELVAHNRNGYGYLTHRVAGDKDDPERAVHFHVKTNGYPISETILRKLQHGISLYDTNRSGPITRVYILERDHFGQPKYGPHTVWEYKTDQYFSEDSYFIPDDRDDQRSISLGDHHRVYPDRAYNGAFWLTDPAVFEDGSKTDADP